MKKEISLNFQYNERGFGLLNLCEDGKELNSALARTGSLNYDNDELHLLNAIDAGIWKIIDPSVDTIESGMRYDGESGRKIRLYREDGTFTHYLIHYDERNDGTKGCIGVQDAEETEEIIHLLDTALKMQDQIMLYINHPVPVYQPEEKGEEMADYKPSVSVRKGAVEAGKVAAAIAAICALVGVDLDADQIAAISIIPGLVAGAIRGLSNWWKNR